MVSRLALYIQPDSIRRRIGEALGFTHVPLSGLNAGMTQGGFDLIQLRAAIAG